MNDSKNFKDNYKYNVNKVLEIIKRNRIKQNEKTKELIRNNISDIRKN